MGAPKAFFYGGGAKKKIVFFPELCYIFMWRSCVL